MTFLQVTGDPKDLFPTGGKQQEPLVALLPNNQLAVGSDEQTILIDSEGNPTMKYSIKWSEVPIALGMKLNIFNESETLYYSFYSILLIETNLDQNIF